GIRDDLVTGVQTCALPICREDASADIQEHGRDARELRPRTPQHICYKIPASRPTLRSDCQAESVLLARGHFPAGLLESRQWRGRSEEGRVGGKGGEEGRKV